MSCGIYKFTSKTTGLSYIGQSIDIERRYNEHRTTDDGYSFHNAIKEHGWEDFEFEILELCPPNQLNEKEQYWVSFYDSYKHGYNETPGGEGSYMSGKKKPVAQYDLNGNFIAEYESTLDAERVLDIKPKTSNIYDVCKGKAYQSNGYQWRYINEDNISSYKLNIGQCPKEALCNSKKIAQCDKNTHEIIKIFNSIREASRETGANRANISQVCCGKRLSANGYYWMNI